MKKFIVILICFCCVFNVRSQLSVGVGSDTFHPGWYITVSGGGNINIAEGNESWIPNKTTALSLKENGGFTARLGSGYNFTPVFGVRSLLVYNVHKWPDVRFKNSDSSYKEVVFKAGNITADLTLNLSNWRAGYDVNRFIDFVVLGGLGIAYREKADFPSDFYSWLVKGGGQVNLHLSYLLDLCFAIDGNLVSDRFNNYVVHTPFELQTAFTVGINYHFR